MLPALAIGGQLLGHAYQNYQSQKANKKYKNFMDRRESELEGTFNQEYYKNALETPGAQSALAIVRDRMKENNQNLNNQTVRTGATAEAATAAKSENNQQVSDMVNKLVQSRESSKPGMLSNYMNQKAALDNQRGQYLQQKRGQWGRFGQNVAKASSTVLDAYSKGLFSGNEDDPNLLGDGGQ